MRTPPLIRFRSFCTALTRTALVAVLTFVTACTAEPVTLFHVHGMGYSADGKRLLVPSHYGIAIYENGAWRKAAGPEHDYMGFSITRDSIYSSGHPAADSPLPNPFGLLKSTDAGDSWLWLGLQRWADFHVMAAGYRTNAVYVLNVTPNPVLRQPGLYVTIDDGKTWRPAAAPDAPEPLVLAAHPDRQDVVFVGAETGLYVAEDFGDSFRPLVPDARILALMAELDGEHLWFGALQPEPALVRLNWKTGDREPVPLPELTQDMVAYVAQNPATPDEIAIATFGRHIFVTTDRGKHWRTLAKDGTTIND